MKSGEEARARNRVTAFDLFRALLLWPPRYTCGLSCSLTTVCGSRSVPKEKPGVGRRAGLERLPALVALLDDRVRLVDRVRRVRREDVLGLAVRGLVHLQPVDHLGGDARLDLLE